MKKYNFLGYDFGASSGRAMLGVYDGEKIELSEIHRFSNDPVELNGRFPAHCNIGMPRIGSNL